MKKYDLSDLGAVDVDTQATGESYDLSDLGAVDAEPQGGGINIGGITKEAAKAAVTPLVPVPLPGTPETLVTDVAKNPSAQQFALGAANQTLGGLPAPIMKAQGVAVPEPQTPTERAARTVGNVVGFAGGGPSRLGVMAGKKVLPKLATEGVLRKAGRLGVEGATAGALSTDAENLADVINPKDKAIRTGIFAGTGAALPLVPSAARFVSKNVGGITDATVKVINRLGPKRVFSPEKADAAYIGKDIVPQLRAKLADGIAKKDTGIVKKMTNIGIPKEEAEAISSLSNENRSLLSKIVKGTNENIDTVLERQKAKAMKEYGEAIKNIPEDIKIPYKKTLERMKEELQGMGWLDLTGNPTINQGIKNLERDRILSIYGFMRDNVKNGLTKQQVLALRNDFEAAVTGNTKFDRIIFQTQKDVTSAFEKQLIRERENLMKTVPNTNAVIASIKEANKKYSDTMTLLQLNKTFKKTGDESFNVFLQGKLNQLGDPKRFQERQTWRNIMGQNLFDDLDAHFANKDFNLVSDVPGAGGGMTTSRSGITKAATSGLTKRYYKDVKPFVKKAGESIPSSTIAESLNEVIR